MFSGSPSRDFTEFSRQRKDLPTVSGAPKTEVREEEFWQLKVPPTVFGPPSRDFIGLTLHSKSAPTVCGHPSREVIEFLVHLKDPEISPNLIPPKL
jgi:hypothetical protein